MSSKRAFWVGLSWTGIGVLWLFGLAGSTCVQPPGGDTVQVANVTFSPAGTSFETSIDVTLSTTTEGASINYTTDGTDPTSATGTAYTGTAIHLTSTTTIKAIAFGSGMTDSAVTQATYTKQEPAQVATPAFSPDGGSFSGSVDVHILSATVGAIIRYTTDGSTPSQTNGTVLVNGGSVTLSSTTTLAAIAYGTGMVDSAVRQATYTRVAETTQVAQPRFTPDGGSFAGSLGVQVTCLTPGATIRYTTDGSTPSQTNGTVVVSGGSVTISSTTTLAAIAYATGMIDSPVKTATYTKLDQVAEPTFSPDGGLFDASVDVQINCATAGVTIRYTTDGTTPTESVGTAVVSGATITITTTSTLKAIAYKNGMVDSTVKSATYTKMNQVAQPTFSPDGDLFVIAGDVQISCATPGVTIRYTTDGSAPTQSNGTIIASGSAVHLTATTALKAIAYKSGMVDSPVKEATTRVMEFVLITAGTFPMGDSTGASIPIGQNAHEQPVHNVTLTKGFYIGKYEVKQAEWVAIMGSNPSSFQGNTNRPVERVSWVDCQTFAVTLSAHVGKTLRLPTEAEWEYACRAGTTTDYSYGNNPLQLNLYAWFLDLTDPINNPPPQLTQPVGGKLANPWGLHDMHGNVWEWVQDWFGNYAADPLTDPTGPTTGTGRVVRGGSWHNYDVDARSSSRYPLEPTGVSDNIGLRLVLEVP